MSDTEQLSLRTTPVLRIKRAYIALSDLHPGLAAEILNHEKSRSVSERLVVWL